MSKPFPLHTLSRAKSFPKCVSGGLQRHWKNGKLFETYLNMSDGIRENDMKESLASRGQALNECPDPVRRQELKSELAREEAKLRRRSLGNIRFVAELYNLQLVCSPIMMRIICSLLERRDEESLVMDVIDLRRRKWIRRREEKPQTMAEREQSGRKPLCSRPCSRSRQEQREGAPNSCREQGRKGQPSKRLKNSSVTPYICFQSV